MMETPQERSGPSASDPILNEETALELVKRRDLTAEVIEKISRNASVMKSRKVRLAVVQHPKTPRRVALPLLRDLFLFELMQVTLGPETLPDVRKVAEEALIRRLEKISLGEKLTLARRASGNIAAELLLDADPRVIQVVLENSRLTETAVVRALLHQRAAYNLVVAVCRHAKWSVRQEVRMALLRNANTPLAQALEFARSLPTSLVEEILRSSDLPQAVKDALLAESQP